MLSRKLLGSGTSEILSKNFLYVWGQNDSAFPFGNFNEDEFPSVPGNFNDADYPVLVSDQKIFNTLGEPNDPYGAVIDASRNLRVFGRSVPTVFNATAPLGSPLPIVEIPYSWTQITTSGDGNINGAHSAAIRSDGKLFTWGSNGIGQLGTGNRIDSSSPSMVGNNDKKWQKVVTGIRATFAIDEQGFLFGWGNNASGQLGTLSLVARSSPIQIGSHTWNDVAVDEQSVVAVRSDGLLFAWGLNTEGRLGTSDNVSYSSPVQVGNSSWKQVSAYTRHVLAINSNDYLFTWGLNSSGQLGLGDVVDRSSPVQVGSDTWKQIAAGASYSAAIRSDNKLFTWGVNIFGTLGDNSVQSQSSPVQIGSSSWTQVAAGRLHTTAIRSDNKLFVWGDNTFGNLGFEDTTLRISSPVQLGTDSWTKIDINNESSLAIKTDNALFGWGRNFSGELGIRNRTARSSPVQVTVPIQDPSAKIATGQRFSKVVTVGDAGAGITNKGNLYVWGFTSGFRIGISPQSFLSTPTLLSSEKWKDVYLGSSHILALHEDGRIFGSGSNDVGQLGIDNPATVSSFVQVASGSWTQISSRKNLSLGIKTDGLLYAWGDNLVGFGSSALKVYEKQTVPDPTNVVSWTQLSSWHDHVLAIASNGDLYAWGNNFLGQLGTNDRIDRSSPVLLAGNQSWKYVSAGRSFSTAIRSDDKLFTWGLNSSGQLGDTTTTSRSSPIQIGSSSWTMVSAGLSSTAAIRSDALIFTWGGNSVAQLGLNDTFSRFSPTQVGTFSWTQVSNGFDHVAAIRTDGTLYVWGSNRGGKLGQGIPFGSSPFTQLLARSFPVAVGSSSWTQVSAGWANMYAIDIDQRLFSVGDNQHGQLGVGDVINRSSLVQVPGSWTQVADASFRTYAIRTDGTLWGWGIESGYLLSNDLLSASSPIQIGSNTWSNVTAGSLEFGTSNPVLITNSDSAAYYWGTNGFGQLGDLKRVGEVFVPTQVQTKLDPIEANTPSQIGNKTWNQVVVGVSHFAAIDSDDSVLYTWGIGTRGQLSGANSRTMPVAVGPLSWSKITSGFFHTLALRSDGRLFAWGDNQFGQLGIGFPAAPFNRLSSPVQVGNKYWKDIATPTTSSLGIDNLGILYSWGSNVSGILGAGISGTTTSSLVRDVPSQISGDIWESVSAYGVTAAAIRSDRQLFTWGNGGSGILGTNSTFNRSVPTAVAGSKSWKNVTVGQFTMAAIDQYDTLWAWGFGEFNGTLFNFSRSSPTQVFAKEKISKVSIGQSHSVALTKDGKLLAWGSNRFGQLGLNDNSITFRQYPVQVGNESWTQIATTKFASAAIRDNNELYVWGRNNEGQLGTGNTINLSSPTLISSNNTVVALHSSSFANNLFTIEETGPANNKTYSISATGLNTSGELGVGDNVSRSLLTTVVSSTYNLPILNNVEKVTLGTNHTIALKETSPGSNTYTFYGMGDNQFGQVGVERNIVGFSGVQSWTQISSSHLGSHVAAIRADGLLFTWGSNLSGQLGDGTRIARSSPVQIGNDSWTQVSAGGENTAAIRSDGRLFTWGTSLDGLLTDVPLGSDAFSRSSPVQVNPAGISFYKSISIGSNHALAIASDDRLIAWGVNSFGQLGNGVVQTLAVPQQIGTSSWTQVSAGASFSAAISSDGRLFTWGINSSGQLGDNTIVSKSSPVQIGTSSWTQVSAGNPQTAAIRLDGILFMWGNNIEGELGDNTIVSKSSPVQIGTSSWKQVVTGTARTIAIRSDDTLWGWGRYGGLESTTYVQRNSSPVQISANSTFSNINLQGTSTIGAISSDGKLYIAASNGGTGTNGDGTTLSRNTLSVLGYESDGSPIYSENTTTIYAPTLGANSNNWTSVVAGTNYTYGLKTD